MMGQLQSEKEVLAEEITESICSALNLDDIFEIIFAFVECKYEAELNDVNNPKLRFHIIQQRFPLAFEESGLLDEIMNTFPELCMTTRLDELNKEKLILQNNISELSEKLDSVVNEMTELQINIFGRVLYLFDNRIIDLAKEEEEIIVIENPNTCVLPSISSLFCAAAWRTLQPTELLLGLQLTPSQPILYRKTEHTWFPGRVVYCHLPDKENSEPKSDKDRAKENELTLYTICLDSLSNSGSEVYVSGPSSLALAFSAAELRQKYPVGARVVSIYRDDSGGIGYYSGLIAEPPSERNGHRYLLFFDDGYTQYSPPNEIFRICHQSKENWKEATESSQEFIKRYLAQYPQRPMVRLKHGQTIETELDGIWIKATVEAVDASLALIKFSKNHTEWIYRGSTRLEPLYSDFLSSQNEALPAHNQSVEVEYNTADVSLDASAKRRKARKSATGNQNANTSNCAVRSLNSTCTNNKPPVESMNSRQHVDVDPLISMSELESAGSKVSYLDNLFKEFNYESFVPHKCGNHCLKSYRKSPTSESPILCSENPLDYKGLNPLEIPFHCGWLRYLATYEPSMDNKCSIFYSAPCGRRLRSMHEVERFLDWTNSQLTADLFSFDNTVVINQEFRAEKTLTHIADLSYGKENVPVPCVNSVDNEVPGYIDYTPNRQPIGNVPLLKDSKFLVCCDCTDNCRDRNKCACQQLTIEASSLTNPNGTVDSQAGYRYRRLGQFTVGGVYECNSGCRCDRRCSNRVVQQGLWVRLQVFKTSRKGWGIRALNAIPKGTFICTYAGAIYDETMAVQEGCDYGDEYQAELDYIETVEKDKEGYESTVEDLNDILNEATTAPGDTAQQCVDGNAVSPGSTEISEFTDEAFTSCGSRTTSENNITTFVINTTTTTTNSNTDTTVVSTTTTTLTTIDDDPTSDCESDTGSNSSSCSRSCSSSSSTSYSTEMTTNDVCSVDDADVDIDDDYDDVAEEEEDKTSQCSEISYSRHVFNPGEPLTITSHITSSISSSSNSSDVGSSKLSTQINVENNNNNVDSINNEVIQKNKVEQVTEIPKLVCLDLTVDTPKKNSTVEHVSHNQASSPPNNTIHDNNCMYDDSPEIPRTRNNSSSLPTPDISDDLEQVTSIASDSNSQFCNSNNNNSRQIEPLYIDLCDDISDSSDSPNHTKKTEEEEEEDHRNDEASIGTTPTTTTSSAADSHFKHSKVNIIFNGNDNEHIELIEPHCTTNALLECDNSSKKANFEKPENSSIAQPHVSFNDNELTKSNKLTNNNDTHVKVVNKSLKKAKSKFKGTKHCESVKPKVQVNLCPDVDKEDITIPTHYYAKYNRINKYSAKVKLNSQSKKLSPQNRAIQLSKQTAFAKKNKSKTIWSRRAGSLPRSFRLLRNATQLLHEADFSKIPVVQLSPLQDDFKQEDDITKTDKKTKDLESVESPVHSPKLTDEEKKEEKDEECVSSTQSADSNKSITTTTTTVQITPPENDSKLDSIVDSPSMTTADKDSPSSSCQSHGGGSLKLKLRRVRSTSAFTAVPLSAPIESKESLSSKANLSETDESTSLVRGLRSRSKLIRSVSLEPEIEHNKKGESSKSQQRESEKHNRHHHHHHHHHHRHDHHKHHHDGQQKHRQQESQQQQAKRVYPVAEKDWLHARSYFNDINPYIMDAKKMGNLGRYLNHSCNPNVFVQNVFIDTHDPRFPEVAFFAKRFVVFSISCCCCC
uniref:Histone-lysine N-methyltransferase n=1 Tax=Trichobilharzia regenti TaxID=157069 RepID=A0AA85KL84_TRIRE|nr:unnamed protein product [Trichobilharzia regenti]